MIEEAIKKLTENIDLSNTETKEVFDEILTGLSGDIQTSAFLSSLEVKKATIDELTGILISINDCIKKIHHNSELDFLMHNISISQPSDYIDFSITNDLICCANDVKCIKFSFDKNNIYNSFSNLGINIENFNDIEYNLQTTNFAYILLDKEQNYYKYLSQIKRQLKDNYILKLTNDLLTPFECENFYIGVDKFSDVNKIAKLVLNLNAKNSIILSSENNLPFVSPCGLVQICEAWKNKIFSYNFTTELLGFKNNNIDDIKCENFSHQSEIINNVFNKKIKNAAYDSIIINAGLALYIIKKAPSLIDGINLAKKTIDDGIALDKLNQLKKV